LSAIGTWPTYAPPTLLARADEVIEQGDAVAAAATKGLRLGCRLFLLPLRPRPFHRPEIADRRTVEQAERSLSWRIGPAVSLRDMPMWALVKATALNWMAHKDARLGAALAYYSIFSLGPIMIIAIAIAGFFFGQDAVRAEVGQTLRGLLGESGAGAVETMLRGASSPSEGLLPTLIGLGALIFAAVGVVVQLKDAFNAVWEVEPSKQSGIWQFVRTYVLSFAAVIAVGFLLLVSLLLTAALAAIGKYYSAVVPEAVLQPVGFLVSFAVIAVLFAMMFKWLPDTAVAWHDVWLGAVLTALLFELGKFLIGLYIGKQGLESTFGAAASLVVVLIWVYYSAQIVLMGAEFTRARALARGGAKRSRHA
jgi:membrane protein